MIGLVKCALDSPIASVQVAAAWALANAADTAASAVTPPEDALNCIAEGVQQHVFEQQVCRAIHGVYPSTPERKGMTIT